MARIARVVVPGYPHHITQRGNRRQRTFFCDEDYQLYLGLMAEWCGKFNVETWAYCLMPNHIHIIAVPSDPVGLRLAIGEAHRRYTRHVNLREGWRGHLWQGRFYSFPMDERHLLAAAKYIERNPVAAGIAAAAGDYQWSSARFHLRRETDALVKKSVLDEVGSDWGRFLDEPLSSAEAEEFTKHIVTGRPLGGDGFIETLEKVLNRPLRKRKPGPKLSKKSGQRPIISQV